MACFFDIVMKQQHQRDLTCSDSSEKKKQKQQDLLCSYSPVSLLLLQGSYPPGTAGNKSLS